jgi:hypothetical protein
VDQLRRDQARAAHELGADGNRAQRVRSMKVFPFRKRQHRRHDHRARMDRPALESVVEVLAVRRGAVHEGGARGVERAGMADGGAAAVRFPAAQRRAHVVRIARRHAQAGDINDQLLDHLPHFRGRRCWQGVEKLLGDGVTHCA